MKKIVIIFMCLAFSLIFGVNTMAITVSDDKSYTYSNEKEMMYTPESYIYDFSLDVDGEISDIAIYNNNIYVLDKTNGTILVYNQKGERENELCKEAKLSEPQGFFISNKGFIYVADTENARVVKFDLSGKEITVIGAPDPEKTLSIVPFKPSKIVVDDGERLYILGVDETNGIYQLDINGNFLGFFGSVPVVPDFMELMWRKFSTKEQLSKMLLFIPTEYSNMDIDRKGFIYTTVSTNTDSETNSYISSGGSDSSLAPIRRLNPKNTDVLLRTASMPPAGDYITETSKNDVGNASRFIDISVNNNDMYCALDNTHSRVFVYDKFGNLLYLFGNNDNSISGMKKTAAICWWNDNIAVADNGSKKVKVYSPTSYATLVNSALLSEAEGNYDNAKSSYYEILKLNSGSTLAYIGIGRQEMRSKNYIEAMDWFKKAGSVDDYSKAYKLYRQETGLEFFAWIFVCLLVLLVFVVVYKKIIKKLIKGDIIRNKKIKDFLVCYKYGFYIMRHPFDGFWDMKFEARGTMASATGILITVLVLNIISLFKTGYIVSGNNSLSMTNILVHGVFSVLLPVSLWCIANWSMTSLMNGSGTLKNIYMFTCYSLTPFIIGMPILMILSNILTVDELGLYTILQMLIYIWVGYLIFCGTLSVHQYTALKTVGTIIFTIVAMAVIVFLFLLCITIIQQITGFIALLTEEISLRI